MTNQHSSIERGSQAHHYLEDNIVLYVNESNSKVLLPALLHTADLIAAGELSYQDGTLRSVGGL